MVGKDQARNKKIMSDRLSILNYSFAAQQTFKLINKYRPESKEAKKARLQARAEARAAGKKEEVTKRPPQIRFGIQNVVRAIETRKVSSGYDTCVVLISGND